MTPRIKLYGRVIGVNDSWARVSYGLKAGLEACGALAGFSRATEDVSEIDDRLGEGFDAPIGVFIGPPGLCGVMRARGDHPHRLALIAANSTWLPSVTMRTIGEAATGIIGPSVWSTSVISEHTELPVSLWLHGVNNKVFQPVGLRARPDAFTGLHLSSSGGQRKGTRQLIEAWARMVSKHRRHAGDATLRMVLDGPPGYYETAIEDACREKDGVSRANFTLEHRKNISEKEMAALFRGCHFVAQPSRSEGFGLVPLEALCTGTPVLMTGCTGHAEYRCRLSEPAQRPRRGGRPARPGVVTVLSGRYSAIDDGPGATAPTVTVDAVATALDEMLLHWEELSVSALFAADELGRAWSWEAVTRLFLDDVAAPLVASTDEPGLEGAADAP